MSAFRTRCPAARLGRWLLVWEGRRPSCEEGELVRRRGSRLGGVGGQREALVGRELHRVEADAKLTHERVAELLGAGAVQTHVVGRPLGAERVAAGGELTDELGQRRS
jgi:hypothetical protein